MNIWSVNCSSSKYYDQHQNVTSLLTVLKECSGSRDLAGGLRAHSQAISTGVHVNCYVITSLINMYAKCGRMADAQKVFDSSTQRSVGAWTSLIRGYAENGDSDQALDIFEAMKQAGCAPNSRTLVAALSACANAGNRDSKKWLERGREIHSQAVKNRWLTDIYLGNTLVNMYGKLNSMLDARRVFDAMSERDVVTWNALLQGYVENGQNELVLELLDVMRARCVPDARSFIAGLSACAALAAPEEKTSGKCRKWLNRGQAIHSLAVVGNCRTVFLESTLVDMYAKCGQMPLAQRVFDAMSWCNVVTWTALISGYVRNGENGVALKLVAAMDLTGVALNSLTFVAALEACGNLMALKSGQVFHAEITSLGLGQDMMVANSLVDFYGKCGCMGIAREIFESISHKSIVSWTALMCGYSLQGCTEQVFEVFQKMEEQQMPPNGVTFVCLLTACSHAGLTEKGKELFNVMHSRHGVSPGVQHYNCVVDLLGRANCLEEALTFVSSMPFDIRPNVVTWKTILSGCVKWNNVRLGRLAYEAVMAIDENSAASCVLMANILDSGLDEMETRQQGKTWWIDPTGLVHEFSTT